MDASYITGRVRDIRRDWEAKKDDERCHLSEDRLYDDVLRAIAAGDCEDPVACATEVLKTKEIEFSRWYA